MERIKENRSGKGWKRARNEGEGCRSFGAMRTETMKEALDRESSGERSTYTGMCVQVEMPSKEWKERPGEGASSGLRGGLR